MGLELARRPGEQQPVQGRPALLGEPGAVVGGQLRRRLGLGPAAQRLAAEGLGPAAGRVPSSPRRKPMTESGMSNRSGSCSKSAGETPAPTRCRARSPTTLEEGVTFTRRPSIRSAAAYMASMSSKRSPSPSAMAWVRRLESCPPGISWW